MRRSLSALERSTSTRNMSSMSSVLCVLLQASAATFMRTDTSWSSLRLKRFGSGDTPIRRCGAVTPRQRRLREPAHFSRARSARFMRRDPRGADRIFVIAGMESGNPP